MGPRKRSKPNPKAEPQSVLKEGPESQTEDSSKSVIDDSLPSNKLGSIESAHSSVNEANTVSAEDGQPVQDERLISV